MERNLRLGKEEGKEEKREKERRDKEKGTLKDPELYYDLFILQNPSQNSPLEVSDLSLIQTLVNPQDIHLARY